MRCFLQTTPKFTITIPIKIPERIIKTAKGSQLLLDVSNCHILVKRAILVWVGPTGFYLLLPNGQHMGVATAYKELYL